MSQELEEVFVFLEVFFSKRSHALHDHLHGDSPCEAGKHTVPWIKKRETRSNPAARSADRFFRVSSSWPE